MSLGTFFKKVSGSVFFAVIANIFVAEGGDMSRCGAVTKTTSKILAVLLDMSSSFTLVAFGAGSVGKLLVYFEGAGRRVGG